MDGVEENFLKEEETDQITHLLELLMRRIEQLELVMTKDNETIAPDRKPVTLGDGIFAPKGGRKKGKKRYPSAETKLLKRTIRAYTQLRLGIDVKSSTDIWDIADRATAQEYNRGGSQASGPTNENFVMDWDCPGHTQWLKDCVVIFGHDFLAQHKAHFFPQIKGMIIDISVVKSSFRDYVLYLKRRYNAAHVDPIDAAHQRANASKNARSLSRRRQLLGRRLALLRHHRFPKDCLKMVEDSLGVDGMSSEDSDGEVGTNRSFIIKNIPWRNEDLTKWLQRVDALPLKNKANVPLARRWKPRNRVVSDMQSTRRRPATGLPLNFYKSDWLMGQDSRSRTRLGAVASFELPKIDEYAP
ncbi:hypothetical protein CPB86DRAFT_841679 [Serendipita vermifera]|nr:hypothetical protein CPB86DRAFT_841679 [Serendipita vermifera]